MIDVEHWAEIRRMHFVDGISIREILGLKGDSYRLRDKDLGSPPPKGLSGPACSASPYGLGSAGGTLTFN